MRIFGSIKEFFENTISTIKDDRFSWRFKLCNIITNDALRLEMAMVCLNVHNIKDDIHDRLEGDYEPSIAAYKVSARYVKRCSERALDAVNNIWSI